MIRKRRDRGYGPIFHDTKFSLIGEFADPTESELERLISLGGGRIVPPDGALNFSSYMIVPQTTTRHEAKMLGRRFGKRSISALWILDSISNGRKLETAKYVVGHTHAAWIRLALIAMPYALKRKAKGLVVFLFFCPLLLFRQVCLLFATLLVDTCHDHSATTQQAGIRRRLCPRPTSRWDISIWLKTNEIVCCYQHLIHSSPSKSFCIASMHIYMLRHIYNQAKKVIKTTETLESYNKNK